MSDNHTALALKLRNNHTQNDIITMRNNTVTLLKKTIVFKWKYRVRTYTVFSRSGIIINLKSGNVCV